MSHGEPEAVLYGYWRSSATWRVRIGLALKGVAYQVSPVHLIADGGQQHSATYRAMNPMREVPTLHIDGLVLTQSLAILEYLEETRPHPPLLPSTPALRATCRQLAEIVNSGMQPVQNLRVLQALEADFGANPAQRKAWAQRWIAHGLDALESAAQHSAGLYLVGESVTLADLCLVPQLYNARRFDVGLDAYPLLRRVDAALAALPAFQVAHPDAQPDAQPSA